MKPQTSFCSVQRCVMQEPGKGFDGWGHWNKIIRSQTHARIFHGPGPGMPELMQDHNIQNISRADWQHFSCKYFREWDSSTTLPVENRIMHLCHLCHLCQQKTSSSIHWYPLKIVLVVKKFQAPRLEIHYIPLRIRWLRVFSVHVSANEMIVGQSCGLITGTSRRGSGRCSTQLILHRRSQLVPCHRANACGPWKFIWS